MESNVINEGVFTLFSAGPVMAPFEYTGYRDEILASKETAYLGTALNESPIYEVSGPDAEKFLTSVCVNNFMKMKEGRIRHAILCNEKGQILTDGVVMKIGEHTYRTYWLTPVIDYYMEKTNMDVQGTVLTGREFFFQIAGPKSLEILEQAAGADFHDIGFARHKVKEIAGVKVRVLRLGMAGTLAYEVHGHMDKQEEVYKAIWEAGQAFGMKKLGRIAYCMNHTEAGFANINTHYPMPWFEEEDIAKFMWEHPEISWMNIKRQLIGSMGDELELRFKTPYDVGWGSLVKFDHDFPGKTALEKIASEDRNRIVTLEWNAEDVAAVYQTQFEGRDTEACESIDEFPNDVFYNAGNGFTFRADWVKADDRIVGSSYGRLNSIYYRRMISLGCIEKEYAQEGRELTLIWGTPGTRQMEIRVKVARCPYMDLENNKDIDVENIPRYQGK